jgi:hypothetical protein
MEEFREVIPRGEALPPMRGASHAFDPSADSLYLYGGFDGESIHNWVWALDLRAMTWRRILDDCSVGTCPYPAENSPVVAMGENMTFAVFPGESPAPATLPPRELYFSMQPGGWVSAGQIETWGVKGDCDGDGFMDATFGARCRNFPEWWNFPGEMVCDTLSGSLACDQQAAPAAAIYSFNVPGLKTARSRGDYVYTVKGGILETFDASDPASPSRIAGLVLSGMADDMEWWQGRLVVASDDRLAVVAVDPPESLRIEREIFTCGKAASVEVVENTAFVLTSVGVGRVSLMGAGQDLDRFALLLPSAEGWELVEIPPGSCEDYLSTAIEYGASGRGFAVDGTTAYLDASGFLVVADLDSDGFFFLGDLDLGKKIVAMRKSGDYLHLNLQKGPGVLVLVSNPYDVSLAGTHDLYDWVGWLGFEDGRACRAAKNRIEIAVWE